MSDETSEETLDAGLEAASPPRGAQRFLAFVPILGLAACCFFLARSKGDVLYFLQPAAPLDLGGPGAYHLKDATDGAFVKIHGVVHSRGARYQRQSVLSVRTGTVWPLENAPVMLERPDSSDVHGEVTAEGMLEVDDRLPPQYRPVISAFLKKGEIGLPGPDVGTAHTWVLVVGHVPRGVDLPNVSVAGLVVLSLLNLWWVIKPILRRG